LVEAIAALVEKSLFRWFGHVVLLQSSKANNLKTNQVMNPIATKLRKLREIHGYPQEYVAFQLGVSQAAYSKKETGRTELSLTVLQQVSSLYNISLMDLISLNMQDLLIMAVRQQ
jgi:DNA-binding XRE family transcriptional regulator